MGELLCLLVEVTFYLIKRKSHLAERLLGFTKRLLGFTKRKILSQQGNIENHGLSDDLLAIDDEEARGSGRWLSGIGGRETTTREVVDARDSGGGK